MKTFIKLRPLLFLVSILVSTSRVLAQHVPKQSSPFSTDLTFCTSPKKSAPRSIFLPSLPGIKTDIHYVELSLRANPEVEYIQGRAALHFRTINSGDTLAFYLHDSLWVKEVRFRGNTIVPLKPGGHLLIIPLSVFLSAGIFDSITISYQGKPGTLAGQKAFFTALHNQQPYLWTLSEPYGAPSWWPCKLNLDDKIDSLRVTLSHPPAYQSASNGMLTTEIRSDTLATTVWKHRYPIAPYLVAIAIGKYAVYEETISTPSGFLKVLNFAYPSDSSAIRQATEALQPVYLLFDSLFGPYPFIQERYGHLQCPMGGGMEHQTLTFAGPFSHHVLSHELAHSWFGNKVTTGSWKDIWLNEGFATYATGLTYQYLFGGKYWKPWKRETIAAVCSQPGGSVYVDDTTNINRIFDARLSYHKAALLLHMIRWLTGDEAFFDALRTYLGFPGLSYGFARTDDLIRILEETSGLNLTGFMSQWFYGEGYPSYTLHWGMTDPDTLQITLYQQTSHPSVTFFDIPVEIQLKNHLQDTLITLYPSYNGQKFRIRLPFVPDSLIFDPELRIISAANQILGTEKTFNSQEFTLFPNPACDVLFINGPQIMSKISLWDASGRMILNKETALPAEISVRHLKPGWYIISVENQHKTIRRKLIVR
ncbi:MAG: M1 family aminopeptidase [Bacteroidales bacterium]